MTTRQQRGKKAEVFAAEFLISRGYSIIEANWHCRHGEIDLIAREGETLVFVEVRARSGNDTSVAFESIGARKQARLVAAVQHYLAAHALDDILWRIDAIAVAMRGNTAQIEHVQHALDW